MRYNSRMVISPGNVIEVGPHRVYCEEDFYLIVFEGATTVEHARELHRIALIYKAQGYLLCLGDMSRASSMDAEARKVTAQLSREIDCPGATALFGANVVNRTLALLVLKAIALIVRDQRPFALFKDESEARAWLDEQRTKFRARRLATSAAGTSGEH